MKWEPIETAPLDNTEVIGCQGMTVEIIRFIPALGHWFNRDENISMWGSFPPTHWMPLPPPPQAQGQIEEPKQSEGDEVSAASTSVILTHLIKRLVQQLQSVSKDTEYQLHQVNELNCTCPLCDGERYLEKLGVANDT